MTMTSPQAAGHRDGVVGGVPGDQDHLVDPGRQGGEHVGEVLRLVQRRDDDADGDGEGLLVHAAKVPSRACRTLADALQRLWVTKPVTIP
jgi:general stress protein YciG